MFEAEFESADAGLDLGRLFDSPVFSACCRKTPPVKKAPVTDRSARLRKWVRPAARQLEVRPLPPEDPLLPREYAPGDPSTADPYAAPT